MKKDEYRVLVVDDDMESIDIFLSNLDSFPFIKIIAKESNGIKAKRILDTEKIDILILDVVMPQFDGFTLLGFLKNKPAVIICSAYNNYAYEAFDSGVVDFISKLAPLDRIKKALLKAIEYADFLDQRQEVFADSIKLVRKSDRCEIEVDWREIVHGEVNDKTLQLFFTDGESEEYTCSGIKFMEKVPPNRFFRFHKSSIVNLDYIENYSSTQLCLADGKKLDIGRSYLEELRQALRRRQV